MRDIITLTGLISDFFKKKDLTQLNQPYDCYNQLYDSIASSKKVVTDNDDNSTLPPAVSSTAQFGGIPIIPPVVAQSLSDLVNNPVIGKAAGPAGQMNTGYVYAPYIPLISTDDRNNNKNPAGVPDTYTPFAIPIWIGEVRNAGFNDLISDAFRNNLNPTLRKIVQSALQEYTKAHKGDKFIIKVVGDGLNGDVELYIPSIFNSIYVELSVDNVMNSSWTTPIRIEIFIDRNIPFSNNRLIYGGHFYSTGCAELNESDVSYAADASSATVSSGDKITKITLEHIYWEDYRNKKGAMKLL